MLRVLLDKRNLSLVSKQDLLKNKLLLGTLLAKQLHTLPIRRFQDAEFSVFSQWGDDGLIQLLVNELKDCPQTFIEFGVENYTEANTRFLLQHNNWRGLIMDGSAENIASIQRDPIHFLYGLIAKQCFITAENINYAIQESGFKGQIGILHIDIDGNDYWVWKSITCVQPWIVIMEYNSIFGSERAITVPYKADFMRTKAHHSNLFFGASLAALCTLAEEKGYAFIGVNSHGNNAFFVRKDVLTPLLSSFVCSVQAGYELAKFKEERTSEGALTFRAPEAALPNLKGLQVFNVLTNSLELL
ncbi:MAG: hypothetical protein EAZ57_02850 [Cytophagales bacterium]|nr:MAG: hypothetical protein EAZ67_03315 [Cytophagales bacterium]TAF61753.1 MAG: hypothetical protein EAZ57_02850 [Cytophagales bacterium]